MDVKNAVEDDGESVYPKNQRRVRLGLIVCSGQPMRRAHHSQLADFGVGSTFVRITTLWTFRKAKVFICIFFSALSNTDTRTEK